ncbi:MAG: hypothetical protein IJQ22_09670 [Bacteroidales bacterium]|nr:hypothetical protein [Bacteroidales bacterium]
MKKIIEKGNSYVSPVTETITLQGGPCMDVASPNGGLQDLITNELLDEGV